MTIPPVLDEISGRAIELMTEGVENFAGQRLHFVFPETSRLRGIKMTKLLQLIGSFHAALYRHFFYSVLYHYRNNNNAKGKIQLDWRVTIRYY